MDTVETTTIDDALRDVDTRGGLLVKLNVEGAEGLVLDGMSKTLKRVGDVTLFADVYRPRGDGPWPVLLMRVPYDKSLAQDYAYAPPLWYARYGYLVVVQDCRGRWASEGEWYPLRHEADDGVHTVDWAARLPGSNGRVGMYGFSYAGATQLLAAVQQPPRCSASPARVLTLSLPT